MESKRIIHIRIRDLRRERELTQEELAEALGISRQSINAMEAGRCLPSLPVAMEIASFFAVPLNQLIAQQQQEWEALTDMLDSFKVESLPAPEQPAVNVRQTDSHVFVEFCLPGFQKDDLDIEVGTTFVTVAGRAKPIHGAASTYLEFSPHNFTRTINLPVEVRIENAEAEMRHGILNILLEKLHDTRPKTSRIQIRG
jgi:HSP20 family protein